MSPVRVLPRGPGANSPYPRVIETRPRTPRPCLGCDRVFMTTVAQRLCPRCRVEAVRTEIHDAGLASDGRRATRPSA